MSEEVPKTLGRYEIQKELGRGMMGVVYRANDPDLGRLVALKTIKLAFAIPEGEKAAFEKRFTAEARAAAGLQHPGIVVVHDVGRDAATGVIYIALEYLEGHTLAEVTADGTPMDWRQALRITEKLAEALHHAHTKGIVHRDIKPANIMVMASSGQPKVMDFGIAKLPASTLTTAGEFFGTPSFMSPEQAGGQPALDGRSDLFSLGCVLYQLVTGKRAFDGGTLPAILMRVMKDDPVAPSLAVPGLPAALDVLLAKALAKDKDQRYQTGHQMAEDIQDILAGRVPRHAGAGGQVTAVAASTYQGDTAPGFATGRLSDVLSAAAGTSVLRTTPRRGLRRRHILLLAALGAGGFLVAGGLAAYLFIPRGGQPAPISFPSMPPLIAPTPAPAPARLEISLVHSLESGSVQVWVDDAVVLEKPVAGRVTKKVLNFRLYKGSFSGTVDVEPGDRMVRVQVIGEGYSGSKRIKGSFGSGMTRLLRAEVTAWPKRELQISWGLVTEPAVALRDVKKRYPTGREALRGVSFEVAAGRVLVLLGTSGSGKTTALKTINGLVTPDEGSVMALGQDVGRTDVIALRHRIGYVIQDVGLLPHLSVADNVGLVPELLGWPKERRRARAREMLSLVRLDPDRFEPLRPRELSGGERQRVGIARALCADPPLLLMDEPFGALDPLTRRRLQEDFRELQGRLGKSVVLVTHDVPEALRLAHEVAVMDAGLVVQRGHPEEIRSAPSPGFVREFVEAALA